ncbi:MAG: hypothetical protein SFV51_31735 [Bryobacteraceae bacterium]|nr:hypothetical protein [Bryobacteraceae bacterium]
MIALMLAFLAPALVGQIVEMRPVDRWLQPLVIDSNAPSFWRDGELVIYSSVGTPMMSVGNSQFDLGPAVPVNIANRSRFPMWIESVWQDGNGLVYAWYHHEPGGLCPGSRLTSPEIGALISFDGGRSFSDFGIVLKSADAPDCSARNGYFASGHGDFSVILDRESRYFYFLFGNYGGDVTNQGVAIARMPFADRNRPAGAVQKYFEGQWSEPGLGGRVSPVFPAKTAWQAEDADAFWGPSIHWNYYLGTYVAVMNRSCCEPGWPQEGIYITFNADLENPQGWAEPAKILGDVGNWYPRVMGIGPGETDSEAGQVVRLYVRETSDFEIVFYRFDELPLPPEPPE